MNNFSRFFFSSVLLLIISKETYSQQGVNYNDVAVIVNMNSDTSQFIANYFMEERNIPEVNLIPVYTSTDEEISDSLFKDYALQIREYINSHNLGTSLNYLVTTKGCPLKVLSAFRDSSGIHIPTDDSLGCNSSAESELMLLPPKDSAEMNGCTPYRIIIDYDYNYFHNPYYSKSANFSSVNVGIYLVTRLDGYTVQDVVDLIDRSGPNTYVYQDSVQFVIDQSPDFNTSYLNDLMAAAAASLNGNWIVNHNTDATYLTHQSNVLGYMSMGSNDGYSNHNVTHSIPHNTWAKGSIAETGVSTSGRSFQPGTIYGQSLIADLIHEGATGAKGYVYEPMVFALAFPTILFDRYTTLKADGFPKYNLAESYFSASALIGWMDVVIGDPKTSITTNPAFASAITVNNNLSLHLFPNPATDYIFLESKIKYSEPVNMSLYDITGRQVWNESADSACFLNKKINLSSFPPGVYSFKLRTNTQVFSMKIAIIR